ncbi:MAG: iron ABC transporter permease [Candidatus Methanomethylophilus sp.]|nr:iron ABC transporter permease [Methanomethylophilus sp.]
MHGIIGEDELLERCNHIFFRKVVFVVVCLIAVVLVAGLAMTIGSYNIGFWESYEVAWNHICGNITDVSKDYVVWKVRMPQIVAGIIAGAGLAICGTVMQGTMKNPLADPYTTGISSGAAFGATIAMVLNFSVLGNGYAIVGNAFIFSLIPMAIIMLISATRRASPTMIILSGIAVMYIFNAMTTVLMLMADPDDLADVYSWQVGSLGNSRWENNLIMAVFVIAGLIATELLSNKINILAAGDDTAKSLRINADHLRLLCLLIVSLTAAAVVSFTGIIGFVGLVCPHICRIFVGSDNRVLIPASAAFGAALMIVSDLIGRTVIAPAVLQVGVITAFIGGPMFIYLLMREKKDVW